MKIAFVTHIFPRLHNTFILNEIVELINQGMDVSVFSLDRSPETIINEDVSKYDLLSKTFYFDDFSAEDPSTLNGFSQYMAPFERKEIFCRFGSAARKLKTERFDVIHAAFGNRPATVSMILSELSGIPFTFEAHAYDLFVDFPFAKQKIEKVSAIATESNYNRDFLIQALSAPEDKVHIVHLSPNKKMLDAFDKVAQCDDLIVSACRLHPIKGLGYALQAVKRVLNDFPSLKYVIIGSGVLKENLVREAIELGLSNVVHFVDDVKNEEVCKLVQQATVFLLPSVIAPNGDRDGTPTAISEAMYLGVPVVSSKVSGIPELVDDGVNGLLAEPANVGQIAEALRTLLSDRALRQQMGQRGKEKIEREFNIHKNTEKLVELWRNIVPGTVQVTPAREQADAAQGEFIDFCCKQDVQQTLGTAMFPKILGNILSALDGSTDVQSRIHAIPSETTPAERNFLFNFFAHLWPATANVLEIGPFLGGTTRAIALGMLCNARYSDQLKLYTCDKFGPYYGGPRLAEYMAPLFELGTLSEELRQDLLNNENRSGFLDIFYQIHERENYFPILEVLSASLPTTREEVQTIDKLFKLDPRTAFDAVFVDGCKSWFSTKYFMSEAAKCTTPGSYFLFQDYGMFTCFWIPVFVRTFLDHFEFIAHVDYTYAYRLQKKLEPEEIERRFPDSPEDLPGQYFDDIFTAILYEAAERSDVRHLVFGKLQHAAAWAYIGNKQRAKELILKLAEEPYSLKYRDKIEIALRTPTHSPKGAVEL